MTKNHTNTRVLKFDKYMLHGKKLKKEEAVKYPIMTAGEGLPEEDVVYLFESQQDFAKWSNGTKHAEEVSAALQNIEKVKQHEKRDNSVARQRQEKLAKRTLEDLQELSERTGLPLSSQELLMAASDDSPVLEGRIFEHSAMLWELSGSRGAAFPSFGLPYPDLNWFRWGNRAVSANVNGLSIFCDTPWYGGQWLALYGIGWPAFELALFAFEFRTESLYC